MVSPYVVAELDYLVMDRLGVEAELAALDAGDLSKVIAVVERYRDQAVGVADASNVVLAERYRTTAIATLDRRHFSVLRPLDGGAFTLLP